MRSRRCSGRHWLPLTPRTYGYETVSRGAKRNRVCPNAISTKSPNALYPRSTPSSQAFHTADLPLRYSESCLCCYDGGATPLEAPLQSATSLFGLAPVHTRTPRAENQIAKEHE